MSKLGRNRNRGPPTTPGDLIGRTITDDQGRTYTYDRFFRIGGAAAKREVQQQGELQKDVGNIRNYRTRKYRLVVQTGPDGGFQRRTVWALYTR